MIQLVRTLAKFSKNDPEMITLKGDMLISNAWYFGNPGMYPSD